MFAELDLYFPYIVLVYGIVMNLVTRLPGLYEKAEQSMNPELLNWFYSHKLMGTVCLFVGGLWSIQRVLV